MSHKHDNAKIFIYTYIVGRMQLKSKLKISGFTLIEIIVVLIIAAILASIALPRFFKVVELSRSTEALVNLGSVRKSIERCYASQRDYQLCGWDSIDLQKNDDAPGSHFKYDIWFTGQPHEFGVVAWRNTHDNGDTTAGIFIFQDNSGTHRCGIGIFDKIGSCTFAHPLTP